MATISNTPAKSNNLAATDKIPVGVQGSDAALTVTGKQIKDFCNESEGTVTSSATNIQSIRIKTTDGKAVEISKAEAIKLFNFGAKSMAELAKGVAEQMIADKRSEDLNNITDEGKYMVGGSSAHTPSSEISGLTLTGLCHMTVTRHFANDTSLVQTLYTREDNPKVFSRTKSGSVWYKWTRLDNFGYSTLSELANGLMGAEYKGLLAMNTDLNNLFTEGYWLRIGGTTVTNAPFNAVLGFTIFVRKEAENSGSTFYTQTLSAGDGKMYKRVYWGSTGWQAWHSIDSFGYSTLSELANGVLGAFTRDVDIPSASFIYGNKSTTSTDLNEINTTGLYEITGKSYTNAPLSTTINGGILSVQARMSDGYQTVIQTLAIANGIYMRSRINGSWSSWKQL